MDKFTLPGRGRARGRARGTPAQLPQRYEDRQTPCPGGLQRGYCPQGQNMQFHSQEQNNQFHPQGQNNQFHPQEQKNQFHPQGQNRQFQPADTRPMHFMAPQVPLGRGSANSRGPATAYSAPDDKQWLPITRGPQPTAYSNPRGQQWRYDADGPQSTVYVTPYNEQWGGPARRRGNHTADIDATQSDRTRGQFSKCENQPASDRSTCPIDSNKKTVDSSKSCTNDSTADIHESQTSASYIESSLVCRPPPGFENRPPQYPPDKTFQPGTDRTVNQDVSSDNEVNKEASHGETCSPQSGLSALAMVFVPRAVSSQSGMKSKPLSPPPGLPSPPPGISSPPLGISLNTLGPAPAWNMNRGLSGGKTEANSKSTSCIQVELPKDNAGTSPTKPQGSVELESESRRLQDYISSSSNKNTTDSTDSQCASTSEVNEQNQPNIVSESDFNSSKTDKESPATISVEVNNNFNTIKPSNPYLYYSTSQEGTATVSDNTEQEETIVPSSISPEVKVSPVQGNTVVGQFQSHGTDEGWSHSNHGENEFSNTNGRSVFALMCRRGRGGFRNAGENQPGRGGFPVTNENNCSRGGFPMTNGSQCSRGGFPMTNENQCGRGGFPVANENHCARGGFPITNESTCGRGGFPVAGHGEFVQPTGYPYLPMDGSSERGRRSSWDGLGQIPQQRRRNRSWGGLSDDQNSSPRHSRSSSLDSMERCRSRERNSPNNSRNSSMERNNTPGYQYGAQNKTFLSPGGHQPLRSPVRSPKYYKGQYIGSGSSDGRSPGASPSQRKEPPDVYLSKSLSMLLRHSANSLGFQLMKGGFLYVNDILTNYDKVNGFNEQDVINIVEKNDKKRFALETDAETGRLKIRANQGHTMQVDDLDLKPILSAGEVDKVIHGTFLACWDSIRLTGLHRMRRNHIHFAVGEPGRHEVISGMRKECEVMVYINMEKALNDGIKFYRSANNVILSPGNENGVIHPFYFDNVVQRVPWIQLEFDRTINSGTMTRNEIQDAIRSSKGQKNKLREEPDRDVNRSPTKQASKKLKRLQARNAEIDLASCGNIFETSPKAGSDSCTSPDFAAESPDDWDDAIVVTDIEHSKCVVDHILTSDKMADNIVFCSCGENLGYPSGKLRAVVVVVPKFVYIYQFTGDRDYMTEGHLQKLICHTDANRVFNDISKISTFLIDQHDILLQGHIWDIELMYDKLRPSLSKVNIDKLADMDFCPKQWRLSDETEDVESTTAMDSATIGGLVKRGKLMFIAFKMFIRCQTEIKKLKREIYAVAIPAHEDHFLAKKIQELKLESRKDRKITLEKQKQDRNNQESVKEVTNNSKHNKKKHGKKR